MQELPLYGLDRNPFVPKVLDPLAVPGDIDLVAAVDGWRGFDDVREYIVGRATQHEPAIVLVTGESMTGRTSAANCLVHEWVKAKKHDRDHVIVSRYEIGHNYDVADAYVKWFSTLKPVIRAAANLKGVASPLAVGTQTQLNEIVRAKPIVLGPVIQDVMQTMLDDISPDWVLPVIIDQVKGTEFVSLATEIFFMIDTIVILIVDATRDTTENLLAGVEAVLAKVGGHRLKLEKLPNTDVRELVEARWDYHRPGIKPPFDRAELERAFADRPRPIAQALKLVADMFDAKQQALVHKSDPWPIDEELAFSESYMRNRIEWIESVLSRTT